MEIKLSEPRLKSSRSIEECIFERHSVRNFLNKPIEIEKISQILWAAQGKKNNKKTVPSAGAIYPLEIYVILEEKGIFLYNFKRHVLELTQEGKFSEKLAIAALNQMFIRDAPLNIIICADFQRTSNRYGPRGKRYVFIEVGHCAQNIHLEAVALDLGSVSIGAFVDESVKKLLNLPDNLDPLSIIPIGYYYGNH